ncbi:unnamed protein product [Mesocestoides corti]|uniref:Uncharacterized protein n=1 Tax=Mesocestoides corti TaxID=53468 RepID=A0A158QUY1_MESCO|nr:unnamed protein product [Mesocestoides corti]
MAFTSIANLCPPQEVILSDRNCPVLYNYCSNEMLLQYTCTNSVWTHSYENNFCDSLFTSSRQAPTPPSPRHPISPLHSAAVASPPHCLRSLPLLAHSHEYFMRQQQHAPAPMGKKRRLRLCVGGEVIGGGGGVSSVFIPWGCVCAWWVVVVVAVRKGVHFEEVFRENLDIFDKKQLLLRTLSLVQFFLVSASLWPSEEK